MIYTLDRNKKCSYGADVFWGLSNRYASLGTKKVVIDVVVPWEEHRSTFVGVWRKADFQHKSCAGRKPIDAFVMFKTLVEGARYTPSHDQLEYQMRDHLAFMRLLCVGL